MNYFVYLYTAAVTYWHSSHFLPSADAAERTNT